MDWEINNKKKNYFNKINPTKTFAPALASAVDSHVPLSAGDLLELVVFVLGGVLGKGRR